MNIFYRIDLQNYNPKLQFLTKTEHLGSLCMGSFEGKIEAWSLDCAVSRIIAGGWQFEVECVEDQEGIKWRDDNTDVYPFQNMYDGELWTIKSFTRIICVTSASFVTMMRGVRGSDRVIVAHLVVVHTVSRADTTSPTWTTRETGERRLERARYAVG